MRTQKNTHTQGMDFQVHAMRKAPDTTLDKIASAAGSHAIEIVKYVERGRFSCMIGESMYVCVYVYL